MQLWSVGFWARSEAGMCQGAQENAPGVWCLDLLAKHVVLAILSCLWNQLVPLAREKTDSGVLNPPHEHKMCFFGLYL